MPYINVYIHFVWTTKNRRPYLNTPALRKLVWQHIKSNAELKDIHVDFVNGYHDHCHCLVSLKGDQTIRKIMQLIKGESAYWINKNQLTVEKFEWQDEYFAIEVCESRLDKVKN